MKCLALAAALVLTAPAAALAGPKEDAAFVVSLSDNAAILDTIVQSMEPMLRQMLSRPLAKGAASLSNQAQDAFIDVFGEVMTEVGVDVLPALSTELLLQVYSPQVLADLAAFGRTPSGAAYFRGAVELSQLGAAAGQEMGAELGQKTFNRVIERLRGSGDMLLMDPSVQEELRNWSRGI